MALGDYVDCSPKSDNVFRTQAAKYATGIFLRGLSTIFYAISALLHML